MRSRFRRWGLAAGLAGLALPRGDFSETVQSVVCPPPPMVRFAFLLASLLVSMPLLAPLSAQAEEKPNFVFVVTDDMSKDDFLRSREIRRSLADRNLAFFRNAYVTNSLCCPSRATLLTGTYVHNHGVVNNIVRGQGHDHFASSGREKDTLATWLDRAGYRTGYVGKYMNRYETSDGVPPGWDFWAGWGDPARYWQLLEKDSTGKEVRTYPQNRAHPRYRHFEDVLGDRALEFLREGQGPFLLFYGSHAPHSPNLWPPRHDGLYAGTRYRKKPSYAEADVSDKPEWVRKLNPLPRWATRYIERKNRERLRSLASVADQITRIKRALAASRELDNTYIVFISDNGWHMGEHRLWPGKRTPYEEDQRVPLAVSGPGVAGGLRGHLALSNDLAPTLAELAGLDRRRPQAASTDGTSLVPLFGRNAPEPEKWRRRFLMENYAGREVPGHVVPPTHRVLRTVLGNWYARYRTGERERYFLPRDPYQLNNVASRLSPASRRAYEAALNSLARCAGNSCRKAEGFSP